MLGHLVKTIILLAKLSNLIGDRFFHDKFGSKINVLLTNFIAVLNGVGDNVAQYQVANQKVTENVDDILEILGDLKYLNLVRPSSLFLQTQKSLLVLKLELVKDRKNLPKFKTKTIEINEQEKKIDRKAPSINAINKNLKLSQSKKKILEFIKFSPNIRTKDIISEFNALSDRTVKRNLMDLLQTGLIKKRVDSKAVYYYASE